VVEAYRYIVQLRHKPAALVLSRQALPTIDRNKYASAAGVANGAYVLADAPGRKPEVILIASGSEVILALQAHEQLLAERDPVAVRIEKTWKI
jgi:transketolase